MTAQLARAFFDLLWLTVIWNWVQTSNSDPRMKKGCVIIVHTMMAVYGSSVERNCFRRFEKQAIEKLKNFILPGQGAVCGRIYQYILPILPPFEHRVLRERVRSLNLLRNSLRKVNHYVGISK